MRYANKTMPLLLLFRNNHQAERRKDRMRIRDGFRLGLVVAIALRVLFLLKSMSSMDSKQQPLITPAEVTVRVDEIAQSNKTTQEEEDSDQLRQDIDTTANSSTKKQALTAEVTVRADEITQRNKTKQDEKDSGQIRQAVDVTTNSSTNEQALTAEVTVRADEITQWNKTKQEEKDSGAIRQVVDATTFDDLCHACRYTLIEPRLNVSCGDSIISRMNSGDTFAEAQRHVSGETNCSVVCDPKLCTRNIVPTPLRIKKSDEDCQSTMSLHQLTLDMVNRTSPPGSPSFQKMLRILQSAKSFSLNMRDPLFDDVENNVGKMLHGYDLPTRNAALPDGPNTTLHVDSVLTLPYVCDTSDCNSFPRIMIQSEQIYAVGRLFLDRIRQCHESPICMVWDFSDYHYDWWKVHNFTESMMLLPIMTQGRLGTSAGIDIPPMHERSIDVAFFGVVTERREPVFHAFMRDPEINVHFAYNPNLGFMRQIYAAAKVCLIAHSYLDISAGETHRLSELGPFGCIPVMETWGDQSYLEHYTGCADVVIANFSNLLNQTKAVLSEIGNSSAVDISLRKRMEWWRSGIRWESVLSTIFG
jgi:hypothetical protein